MSDSSTLRRQNAMGGRARAELLHGIEPDPVVAARVFDYLGAIWAEIRARGA
jgi:hypothetical protein